MFPGWLQILLVVLLIVLLFGRGKISELMGDVAKGIRSFRQGLSGEDGDDAPGAPNEIEGDTAESTSSEGESQRDETRTS